MISLSLESLLAALQKRNHDAKIQEETKQIYSILKIEQREFPLFLRIFPEEHLLQMLAFLPCQIKEESKGSVARLLHLFNKELDMPGFGMDEVAQVAFFRCMVPSIDDQVNEKQFDNYFAAIEMACKTFSPTVEAIASGAVDFDDLLNKAIEAGKE